MTRKEEIEKFLKVVTAYLAAKGEEVGIEGERALLSSFCEGRGYNIDLWYEPETLRVYCECEICNVFPNTDQVRWEVTYLLNYLTTKKSKVGGIIGISKTSTSIQWKTYCQLEDSTIDASLIEEVIQVGVGTFDKMIRVVKQMLSGAWPKNWWLPPSEREGRNDLLMN